MPVKSKMLQTAASMVTAALAAAAASAAGVPTLDVRARTGDPAPGGGTYAGFADVVLNDVGQIAFNADLAGDAPRGGLFLGGTDGTAAAVARVGQQLPSGSTAQSLSRPALDDAGRVTLHAGVAYAGGGGGHELHRYDGGQLTAVAANGMVTTDGRTIDTVDWRPAYAASESGRVVLRALLENPGVSGTLDAILLSGPGGSLEAVAVEGEPAPTVPGVPARTYGGFTPDPSINDAGQVGFSSFSLPGGPGGTFLKSPGEAAQAVLVPGQDVPSGEIVFAATSPTSITADGRVLVQAALRPSPGQSDSSNFALYLGDGTSIETIAREGQPLLSGTAASNFFAFSTTNRAGQAAFVVDVVDTQQLNTFALVRGDRVSAVELTRTGRAAPGGGVFSSRSFLDAYGPPAINDGGQVAFTARLAGEPAGEDLGIYFFDDRLGLVPVAVPGDVIDGEARRVLRLFPLGRLEVGNPTAAYRTGPLADGLNDLGQVAFTYESDAGGSGVAVWTPPDVDDLLAGDADLDGAVTIADFAVLRANFGGDAAYFTTGDFDGDGGVTIADFALLRANFGGSVGEAAGLDAWAAAAVPEPAGLALLAAGGLGLARRRVAGATELSKLPKPRV